MLEPFKSRIFVCTKATNMRCSFSGLTSQVKHVIEQDPLSGHLFVFFNRRADYVKALYWDDSGFCIWSKRLEVGTFEVPKSKDNKLEITPSKLKLILDGISLKSVRQRKRFSLENQKIPVQ